MLELAISTRGASAWVLKTATGLPDCTSSVSSGSSSRSDCEDGVEALPVAGRLAAPAVDDQVLRVAGHLRVEVVLQHAVGGFDEPVLAGQGCAAWGVDFTCHVSILQQTPRVDRWGCVGR